MCNHNRFAAAFSIPVLLAVLACSALAASSGGKEGHYPGQDCTVCHKVRGKSTGKPPAKSTPAKTTTGTGSSGSQTDATPAKGAAQPR